MTTTIALYAALVAPWVAAAASFALGERARTARTVVNLASAAVALAGSAVVAVAATQGRVVTEGWPLLGARLALSVDMVGALFAVVASALWLITVVYADGYLSHASDKARFFGFFALCVGSAIGVSLSANLLTLFVFYEVLTLATYPLVVHNGGDAAVRGGRTYLAYALTGGAALAAGTAWLYLIGGGADFASGGSIPATVAAAARPQLIAVFALLMAGFGVKAALFPLHGWLPKAMVAPAPVSALLHAVAVVKAGVFGIARVILDVYGTGLAGELGVLLPLAAVAAFTIVFGSVRALAQNDIKKRLAYSTIAQLSYIVLGLALATPVTVAAALAHLAHHAVLKIALFFTAGTLAEELHITKVSELDGVGRRMPATTVAFTIAALGIVGIPPIAGFASKWGIATGAASDGRWWVVAILAVSTLLSAAYLLPMVGRIWFRPSKPAWQRPVRPEGDRRLTWPVVVTASAGALFGLAASLPWSPMGYAARAVGIPVGSISPWVPGQFALDMPGFAFLVLCLVVWTLAAVSAWRAPRVPSRRFRLYFALTAAGSVGVAFAAGPAAFYTAFSMMALCAYALVAHDGTPEARRAARIYLAFTLVSEALLFCGFVLGSAGGTGFVAGLAASNVFDAGVVLVMTAFAMKIGGLGFHGWMPVAYAVVPPGAAGAFAGVVSTAGAVGLLRFMPGGSVAAGPFGEALMALGIAAAFFGVVVGTAQRDPRAMLGYSSMSQFGLMTVGIGAGLSSPDAWPVAVAAVSVYLVHHGVAKAALFFADDLRMSLGGHKLLLGLTTIPALALAGLPLTSGAVAKIGLKGAVALAPAGWAHAMEWLLPLAAFGTTVLMARYLQAAFAPRAAQERDVKMVRERLAAFIGALAAVASVVWLMPVDLVGHTTGKVFDPHYLWILAWPVAAGIAVAAVVGLMSSCRIVAATVSLPLGDVWAPVFKRAGHAWSMYQERLSAPVSTPAEKDGVYAGYLSRLTAAERTVISWTTASLAILALLVAVLMLSLLA